jgi:hypothetical protein
MTGHDLNAGLYATVELLLVEEEDGCRVIYQLPSGLVAGHQGCSALLKREVGLLDGKLEALVRDVTA